MGGDGVTDGREVDVLTGVRVAVADGHAVAVGGAVVGGPGLVVGGAGLAVDVPGGVGCEIRVAWR